MGPEACSSISSAISWWTTCTEWTLEPPCGVSWWWEGLVSVSDWSPVHWLQFHISLAAVWWGRGSVCLGPEDQGTEKVISGGKYLCVCVCVHACWSWNRSLTDTCYRYCDDTCDCGNMRVDWILKKESAQKVDPGEENSSSASAGTWTGDLSITSPALYPWAIPTPCLLFFFFVFTCLDWLCICRKSLCSCEWKCHCSALYSLTGAQRSCDSCPLQLEQLLHSFRVRGRPCHFAQHSDGPVQHSSTGSPCTGRCWCALCVCVSALVQTSEIMTQKTDMPVQQSSARSPRTGKREWGAYVCVPEQTGQTILQKTDLPVQLVVC